MREITTVQKERLVYTDVEQIKITLPLSASHHEGDITVQFVAGPYTNPTQDANDILWILTSVVPKCVFDMFKTQLHIYEGNKDPDSDLPHDRL